MSDMPAAARVKRSRYDTVGWGVLLAIGVHIVGLSIVFAITLVTAANPYAPMIAVACAGWSQLVYMPIPIVVLVLRKQHAMLKGLLIVVGVGFLITSTCVGLM